MNTIPTIEVSFRSLYRLLAVISDSGSEFATQATWQISLDPEFDTVIVDATSSENNWNAIQFILPEGEERSTYYIRSRVGGDVPILDENQNYFYDSNGSIVTVFEESDWSIVLISEDNARPNSPTITKLNSSPQRVAVKANYSENVSDVLFQLSLNQDYVTRWDNILDEAGNETVREVITPNNFFEYRIENLLRSSAKLENYYVRAKTRTIEDFYEDGTPVINDSLWSNEKTYNVVDKSLDLILPQSGSTAATAGTVKLIVENLLNNSIDINNTYITVSGLGFPFDTIESKITAVEGIDIDLNGTTETLSATKISYDINNVGTATAIALQASLVNPPLVIGNAQFNFISSPKELIQSYDLLRNTISGSVISPGSIDGASLSPNIEIGTKGFNGFELVNNDPNISSANTVVIGPSGIVLRDPNQKEKISLPTDANSIPLFSGSIIADSLTSTDARLGGASRIPAESTLTLSSGQIKSPIISPLVNFEYPQEYEWSTTNPLLSGSDAVAWNLWLDSDYVKNGAPKGGASTAQTVWTVIPYSGNAAVEWSINETNQKIEELRRISVAGECHAACRVGDYIYVMFYRSSTSMYINSYNRTTLALVASQSISVQGYEPTMLPDPNVSNSLLVIDANNSSGPLTGLRIRTFTINTSSSKIPIGSLNSTTPVATATITGLSGFADLASMSLNASFGAQNVGITTFNTLYISVADTVKERILKYSLTRPSSAPHYITGITVGTGNDANFTAAWGEAAAWGIAWDDKLNSNTGGFWLHDGLDGIYRTNNSTDISTYSFGYTFEGLTGSTPTYTTTLSEDTKAYTTSTRKPYANIVIAATQVFSGSANSYGFYAKKTSSTAWSNYYFQDRSNTKTSLITLGTSGSSAPTANTFPSGTVASIKSEATASTSSWALNGDGTVSGITKLVAVFSKAGTITTSTGTLRWYNDSGITLNINKVRASVGTAPTGSSLIVDVNVNGSTIYSTQSNRPTIATATTTATGAAVTATIADGQYLTVDVDQVGSTTSGSDLVVTVWLSG